jgi:hypothetical protein
VGAWGAGLYSSDMAADMRAVIKSTLRLPLDEDGIVRILRDCEPAADDPNDEDHTTFWLVLADQFEKRGVAHAPTREKAIAIIDQGDDLAMMERLGMRQADLRKRGANLADLRARLATGPRVAKRRATMKAPDEYLLDLGVLYACPVKGSSCINPYLAKAKRDTTQPDGWRQFVIVDRGRAFDYIAWYQPLVCKKPVSQEPRLLDASDDLWWELDTPKTCPPRHFESMQIVSIGSLPIDMEKVRARFAKTRPGVVFIGWGGRGAAVNDVSIADSMCPTSNDWERWYAPRGLLPQEGPTMLRSLKELLSNHARS